MSKSILNQSTASILPHKAAIKNVLSAQTPDRDSITITAKQILKSAQYSKPELRDQNISHCSWPEQEKSYSRKFVT